MIHTSAAAFAAFSVFCDILYNGGVFGFAVLPIGNGVIVNVIYFSYKAAMPQTVWIIRQGKPTPYEK
ncbi:hypothetical protein [Conchiformibius steedae]|uniref:Uncharacterized protein n=1 Tax=Conchiformibius steedae TaxID=153493 RepID=A0A3P2A4G9_9NEIS|nr:hypothetical protein [Conchiformibius steedae]RRD90341.1 hypothetical protein EII21_05315 [Conchiformibius steedae]